MPFGINFYGQPFESLWVNNNGNVTFDGPLATYTPFGLAETGRQIIAPFFADVDTRAGSTVRYGWGATTYDGHRAFCVNWVDVGYYAARTDKTNSFQLLIVEREDTGKPGDFDIVFNYDRIEWETGDASGGNGGLGGSSATAGFSNGTGEPESSYQLPGSAVNGALLDSDTQTGLSRYSTSPSGTTSPVAGRHVFAVRGGGAPPTNYVALGDSYQSGEGAGDYLAGTDTDSNRCHRSAHAYPRRLVDDGVVNLSLDFGACSAAKVGDLDAQYSTSRPPFDDGSSQLSRLDSSTKLVTIGIGGNDLDFSGILGSCIKSAFNRDTCQEKYDSRLEGNWAGLVESDLLPEVYREIRSRAPYARIVVLGYPRFYVEGGNDNPYVGDYCAGVRVTDQIWINDGIRRLDDYISDESRALGLQYVDTYDTPEGHELCSPSDDRFLNGIRRSLVESYHPNEYGHALLADEVARALASSPPGDLFNVHPGETINRTFDVDGGGVDVSTQWPGSDVVLSLTSPSGRVINRGSSDPDVDHEVGPTFESYHVQNAEAGTWTATLFGAQVAAQGEETRLDIYRRPTPNMPPTARIEQQLVGRTVQVDGSRSTDPDGSIVKYKWDFGDGATAAGPTATHTYTEAGEYVVSLATLDDRGRWDVTTQSQRLTIPRYDFTGFFAPVENAPRLNVVKAKSAVPMKFSLGGAFGLDVLADGSPSSRRIDCATGEGTNEIEPTASPGSSGLQYDDASARYSYVWKTSGSWAGTCRDLTVTLDDGSTHRALFRLR